jgi:formylglycine-generating enzyme required for sulfatase activity
MKKTSIFIALILLSLSSLQAENKTALIIGNGAYSHFPRLTNPKTEAINMKDALKEIGFEVILVTDGSKEDIYDAIADFEYKLNQNAGIALFHYGGHGVQARGDNYLIPVDSNIPDEMRLKSRAIDVSDIVGTMEASKSTTNIIILDACRDNPLPAVSRSGSSRGLAKINAPENSLLIYSAEAGETARDGIFTPTLLKYIKKPGLSLRDIMMDVRRDVMNATGGEQRPGEYSMLIEEVFLAGTGSNSTRKPGFQVDAASYGSIKLSLAEKGTIYVDGVHMGSLDAGRSATLSDITTGNHQIDIRYDSHSEQRSIQVNENKTAYATFNYKAPAEKPQINDRMVHVQGGTFQMGSTAISSAKPVHSVTLSDFYIGKYEVTQGEYKALMGKSPSDSSYGIGDNYSVNKVSWNDAVEYCNALSRKEGLTPAYNGSGNNVTCNFNANGYRLPTEAEWEYAARGGRSSKGYTYAGSNNIDAVAWYWKNSGDKTLSGDWNLDTIEANNGKNHPVGQKQANELGLYDMTGNVGEWCWDWYGTYSSGSQSDPTGTSTGTNRIKRGGSWSYRVRNIRSAYRIFSDPSSRYYNLGFRVVRRL